MKVQPVRPQGSSAGKWVALVVVLVVAAAAGGWYFFLRSTPEQTVKGFLEASQRDDAQAVTSYMSAESVKLMDQMGGSSSVGRMFAPAGSDQKYTIGQATITGDTATVPVKMPMPKEAMLGSTGGGEFEWPFTLVKEEGKWKVDLKETWQAMLGALTKEMMKGMTTSPGAPGMPGMGAPSAPPAPPK